MDAQSLSCELTLTPDEDGEEIALAFRVLNGGDGPAHVSFFRPFLGFELTVRSEHGAIPLVRPASSIVVEPRAMTIEAGGSGRIDTPVRLCFDPSVPPSGGDDPTRWSLPHEPVPLRLEAELLLNGRAVGPCVARYDPWAPSG